VSRAEELVRKVSGMAIIKKSDDTSTISNIIGNTKRQ
jgi:hypothetical protein